MQGLHTDAVSVEAPKERSLGGLREASWCVLLCTNTDGLVLQPLTIPLTGDSRLDRQTTFVL